MRRVQANWGGRRGSHLTLLFRNANIEEESLRILIPVWCSTAPIWQGLALHPAFILFVCESEAGLSVKSQVTVARNQVQLSPHKEARCCLKQASRKSSRAGSLSRNISLCGHFVVSGRLILSIQLNYGIPQGNIIECYFFFQLKKNPQNSQVSASPNSI